MQLSLLTMSKNTVAFRIVREMKFHAAVVPCTFAGCLYLVFTVVYSKQAEYDVGRFVMMPFYVIVEQVVDSVNSDNRTSTRASFF